MDSTISEDGSLTPLHLGKVLGRHIRPAGHIANTFGSVVVGGAEHLTNGFPHQWAITGVGCDGNHQLRVRSSTRVSGDSSLRNEGLW